MKITLWSAGENGRIAKIYKVCSFVVITLWALSVAVMMLNGPYTIDSKYPELDSFLFSAFFILITSFIPFIAIATVSISKRCLHRNTKFTIEVINNVDMVRRSDIKADQIVYGDNYGIVITNNKQAFEDWSFFYSVSNLYDFYDVQKRLGL